MKNFDSFGVMIDCSRNAVPSVPSLKRFFSLISKMGYNCAMLYTEETYEIEGEPFFGYKRGRYSVEELRELDEYASSVGIELIPCIQTLAHLNAAFRWDRFRRINDIDDILMAGEEEVYELIEKMFRTLSSCIRSRRIHIGMDEAHHIGLGRYLDKNGYHNRHEILLNHLNRVCEIAKKYGYETMMWEDMFFRLSYGAYSTNDVYQDVRFSEEIRSKVPENCTMVYWDYYGNTSEKYAAMLRSSLSLCDKVWFAGGAWCWNGFTPHNRTSIPRNALAIPECIKAGVRNALITLWGDDGGECSVFDVLPALMNAAGVAEGLSEEEMKARFREITGEDYDEMIALDLPNYVFGEDVEVGSSNYSKNRLYNDPFLGIANINNRQPVDVRVFADYAARLHASADKKTEFAYLYETQARLADILTLKFDLGIRTRALYEAGDKAGLRKLAKKDYAAVKKAVDRFYLAYRDQWYKVNKSYGFEIQDIRLGGLSRRIGNCADQLLAYAAGKIDRIAELEEPVLENDGGNLGGWNRAFSGNVMCFQQP